MRREAVGICGSDYHFFAGELSDAAGGSQFPRVQGHEVGGDDRRARAGLPRRARGRASASRCGRCTRAGDCYPCSVGRPNTCDNFELIGIHRRRRAAGAAGASGRTRCSRSMSTTPRWRRWPSRVSIAVRAVQPRARSSAASGSSCSAPGRSASASAWSRASAAPRCWSSTCRRAGWSSAAQLGADGARVDERRRGRGRRARWAGGGGPPVVIDATGAAAAVRAMVDMVASAGRAVQVGMSSEEVTAAHRQPYREGDRSARRQLLRRRRVRRGGRRGRAQRRRCWPA